MFHYHINPDSDIPIYRQLVDQINAQIRSGALQTGDQLPTVREMAERLQLSCGTIKHVYDCLQEMGDIEMTRRRGTFVKYVRKDRDSRKQQAMNAIDHMIRTLSELNFSPAEIQIFLNLKMREWGLKWSGVRIAVVTEYTELTGVLEKQLACIANAQTNVYSLRQLREYPYSVEEQSDVILTSVEDATHLLLLLPDNEKLIRIAWCTDPSSLVALAGCSAARVGVLCEEDSFALLVRRNLPDCVRETVPVYAQESLQLDGLDALVIAQDFESRLSIGARQRLDSFARTHPVYSFASRLDEGSMLYLEERISKLRDERQLWPSAMHI